jgi:hypothetical protein
MASKTKQCEFFLLRYVPNALRGEFVNIGVVVRDEGRALVRFAPDWRRVRCLDPNVDVELLDALTADLRARLEGASQEKVLHIVRDAFSSALQVSPEQGVLAESLEDELARLAEIYLSHPAAEREPRGMHGRAAIAQAMRSAFERAGVWAHMRHNIAVAPYTRKGDPLKLDCGYQPNGVVKLFHAVSLEADPNLAKVLAYSFPQVRAGIAREQIDATLTAVIESELDRKQEPVAFALETLAAASVQIATTAQMAAIAETARTELRL